MFSDFGKKQDKKYRALVMEKRKKLREMEINPKDLLEFNLEEYNAYKSQGLSIEKMREKKHPHHKEDVIELPIEFSSPSKGQFSKKGVFLPEKDTVYQDFIFSGSKKSEPKVEVKKSLPKERIEVKQDQERIIYTTYESQPRVYHSGHHVYESKPVTYRYVQTSNKYHNVPVEARKYI